MMRLLPFLALALLVQPASAQPATDIAAIAAALDLTSFPNSTGPRRQPGLVTPADYGFVNVEIADDTARLTQADASWLLTLTLLETGLEPIICFRDKAQNGGSYSTLKPLRLALDGQVYRVAETLPARPDCGA